MATQKLKKKGRGRKKGPSTSARDRGPASAKGRGKPRAGAGKGKKKAKKRKTPVKEFSARRVARGLLYLLMLSLPIMAWGVVAAKRFPDVARLETENPETTAMMQYRIEGARRRGDPEPRITQFWVPLDKVSEVLKKAILASEDDRFYTHNGFDTVELKKAVKLDLRLRMPVRGASTITQQLAKNLYLSPERSLTRKLEEAAITVAMERRLTKDRILELYLNIIEMGHGLYGVESASRRYFKKPASSVEPFEAALMAAAIPAPHVRNPANPSPSHKKKARRLLLRLQNKGALKKEDLQEALQRLR